MDFSSYELGGFYDELFESPNNPHPGARLLLETLGELSEDELQKRHQAAELALMNMGITFNVYGSEAGVEKIFPFDIIPRIVSHTDWTYIEKGLEAAHPGPQPLYLRHLRRSKNPQRRRHSPPRHRHSQRISKTLYRPYALPKRVVSHLRH